MKISFLGAAKQVTGSMHLIELDSGYKILLDCGLDYEQLKHFHYYPNDKFPFSVTDIDLVILSHAHIDHSGNLPNLIRQGFSGQIICTPPTAELVGNLLLDSAKIQDYEYRKNKKGKLKKPKPLYGEKDVQHTLEQLFTLHYHQLFKINNEISMEFFDAGHLLGAAVVKLTINEKNKNKTILFTGDIGRNGSELLSDAETLPEVDIIISESTYGDRMHIIKQSSEDELMSYVQSCCIDKMGKLIIPAFSVGRTQSILFTLHKLYRQGKLPEMPIYVDSPLAIKSTYIYENYIDTLNEDAKAFYQKHRFLFKFDNLKLIEGRDDLALSGGLTDRCIIVSAAGMVEGGRIQQHVSNHISSPYATILIAGYCAEGTLGHKLLQGMSSITIKGKEHLIYAQIAQTDVFSSHADKNQLFAMLSPHKNSDIYLVHGDEKNMNGLANNLKESGCKKVIMPESGQSFTY
jgi:metallo-beta-lactamase family protein